LISEESDLPYLQHNKTVMKSSTILELMV